MNDLVKVKSLSVTPGVAPVAPIPAVPGHWETDYSQVWVPNIVYTRHERCICTVCGAVFDSKSSFYAHSDTMWAQGQDHGGYVDDSYTTTKDQGHYEQQATGQHWVVDIPGHWE